MRAFENLGRLCILAVVMSAACAAQDSVPPAGVPPPVQPPAAPTAIDCATYAAGNPSLDLISKLCGFALTYRGKLPDFIAQQNTTSLGPGSRVAITAQVTYQKGLEHYSQITINGKAVPADGRSNVYLRLFTSGEFGPLLINLFEEPGAVEFTFKKTDTKRGVSVATFDFYLPKDKNTFWAIRDPHGATLKPEFRGHLYLEVETGRIVREEVQPILDARQSSINSMKLAVDYSAIKVGDLGIFLLPVRSESEMCLVHVGSSYRCTKNVATFHDYQKFTTTSRVVPAEAEP